jgi:hypothetical protein
MEVRLTLQAFDRSKLAKDILWTISPLGDGKKFISHDGRENAIVSGDGSRSRRASIDVAVKVDGENKAVARYPLPQMSAPVSAIRSLSACRAGNGAID